MSRETQVLGHYSIGPRSRKKVQKKERDNGRRLVSGLLSRSSIVVVLFDF